MLDHLIVFVQLDQLNVVPTMHKIVCKAYVWHVAIVAVLLRGKGGGGGGDACDYVVGEWLLDLRDTWRNLAHERWVVACEEWGQI